MSSGCRSAPGCGRRCHKQLLLRRYVVPFKQNLVDGKPCRGARLGEIIDDAIDDQTTTPLFVLTTNRSSSIHHPGHFSSSMRDCCKVCQKVNDFTYPKRKSYVGLFRCATQENGHRFQSKLAQNSVSLNCTTTP